MPNRTRIALDEVSARLGKTLGRAAEMTDSRATRRGQRELNEVRPPIELEQADFPELLHWDVPLSNASDEPTPGFTFESSMISANVPCEHGLILHNRSWRTIASRPVSYTHLDVYKRQP